MKSVPLVIVAVVVLVFLAVGGYLILGWSGGGGGQARTIELTVTGNTMTPDKATVRQGDRVTMNVRIDKKETVHLHGYDIEFEAETPGDIVSKTFTADKTGSFLIEIEDTGIELGSMEVQPG